MGLSKWLKRKRTTIDRLQNKPIQITVGPAGTIQKTLNLREPTMMEMLNFIEDAVSDLTPVFANNMEQLDKIATSGTLHMADMKILQPAFVPICGFICTVSDNEELRGELHEIVTVAQFAEIVNALFELIDLPRLWVNFSGALAKMTTAQTQAEASRNLSAR